MIVLAMCSACEVKQPKVASEDVAKRKTANNKKVPQTLLQVDSLEAEEHERHAMLLEDHFFGSFHNERAEFYVIDAPKNLLLGSKVNTISLYYIDGVMCKTKYNLQRSISEALMKQYGTFKIVGLDARNKEIIKQRRVLETKQGRQTLNDQLNRFEMIWEVEGKILVYREVREGSATTYDFTEKLKDYERRLRSVEVMF